MYTVKPPAPRNLQLKKKKKKLSWIELKLNMVYDTKTMQ